MNHVFHRQPKNTMPTVSHGDGCYLVDTQGKRYFDGSCGAAVSCLGHSDEVVNEAIKTQLDKVALGYSGFFTSEPMEELADFLVARAPGNLDRVYFVSGGSEAMEAAIKLARQYYLEIGEPGRHHVIARRQSYHGNTLGALSAGGNMWRREPFSPMLNAASHISPCYEYRGKLDDETSTEYGLRVANELETEIERLGPENVLAFVAEPVVGATLGAVSPVEGYFKRIREICNQYGILLILDEVMCGMGRTGTLFACEQDDIVPDIIAIAKGMGAGYQPIGATLCTDVIYDAVVGGTGFFQHGHTYQGHTTACAASLAVLKTMEERGLVDHVKAMGAMLRDELILRFGQHPHIGDIRGRGLFLGLEIVADRSSKQHFDPSWQKNVKIKKAAFAEGLICYPMGGTLDGKTGDHVLLAPPFILQQDHVGEIVDKLDKAFSAVL
ncbi:MAG: aspartate aminotransferase family protein [Pseudomonadota bacterium]